jgi:hypothetical protein
MCLFAHKHAAIKSKRFIIACIPTHVPMTMYECVIGTIGMLS